MSAEASIGSPDGDRSERSMRIIGGHAAASRPAVPSTPRRGPVAQPSSTEDQVANLESSVRQLVARDSEQTGRIAELEAGIERLRSWVAEVEQRHEDERRRAATLEAELLALRGSRGWRLIMAYRRLHHGALRVGRRAVISVARALPSGRVDDAPATTIVGAEHSTPLVPLAPVHRVVPQSRSDARSLVTGIRFPEVDRPRVSVVIPVHGLLAVTVDCLRAIAATAATDAIEVIVADDASPDETVGVLSEVPGLRLVSSQVHRGFVDTAAMGAGSARGEHIMFLNNDTEVQPGWLDALLEVMEADPQVGAVGAKLIYGPDRLQEAGCAIWSDGTGCNLGHDEDPQTPRYNVRREVDYCSAAALLVRRDAYVEVGGLDIRFAPGYYEDTDLCFALRAKGYRVIYEPSSVVLHHRGLSYGDEARSGQAAERKTVAMETNRRIFMAKWGRTLARHWPPGTWAGVRGGQRCHGIRVLICDHRLPTHDRDSGGLRMFSICQMLAAMGCEITFLPHNLERLEPYARELQQIGVEVVYRPWGFDYVAQDRGNFYDIVLLSRWYVATDFLDGVRRAFPDALVVYDTVDLHHVRELRRSALTGDADDEEIEATRRGELDVIRRSDIVATVSEEEAEVVRALEPEARTLVLPNVHVISDGAAPGFDERTDLLFIGGYEHPPNVDAMRWFVEEILPLVDDRIPSLRLWCLGSQPTPEMLALRSPRIIVPGQIPDVSPYFNHAKVFVAPLRYGAGVKGKVGQAMALGLPVVTTSVGAEGIGVVDAVHALIRDDPRSFADAVVSLATDARRWESMARAAREMISATMSPDAMRVRLGQLLDEVGERGARLDAAEAELEPTAAGLSG